MEIFLKLAFGIGLMMLIGIIYFAPYRLARRRGHPQAGSILILNLFAGFTGIGWIIAYAFAHSYIAMPQRKIHSGNVVNFHGGRT